LSASFGALPVEGERMARRRYQNPKLQLRGDWWTIRIWQDVFQDGHYRRSYKRVRLAPATMKEREVQKVALNTCCPSIRASVEFFQRQTSNVISNRRTSPLKCHFWQRARKAVIRA